MEPTPLTYPYMFSIHLIAATSLMVPRCRCVVDKWAYLKMSSYTVSFSMIFHN